MDLSLRSAPPAAGLAASPLITGHASTALNPPASSVSRHPIRFTGSGSEYFRIWVVNLLLMLVTLGLYYPWAKVRKLRYIYGNTVVAGHPLDFHGNPRQMLRGFLLVSVLMVLYSVAGQVSPTAGAIAGLIVALLWPALLRASLQFRLANTSWRGLRFGFTGSLKDAYLVFLVPMLAAAGVMALSLMIFGLLPRPFRGLAGPLTGLIGVLGVAAVLPHVWWRLKRYQHAHYALGQLQTSFKARYRDVLGVFVRTGLIGVAGALALILGAGLLVASGILSMPGSPGNRGFAAMIKAVVPILLALVVLSQIAQGPYFTSRMQNLVWTHTGNRHLRFKSHLKLLPLMWLTVKNWVLILLTLGLYWPFAAMAQARIRLESIVIHTRQDPDLLLAQAQSGGRDAAGDLAADLIGIDVGL